MKNNFLWPVAEQSTSVSRVLRALLLFKDTAKAFPKGHDIATPLTENEAEELDKYLKAAEIPACLITVDGGQAYFSVASTLDILTRREDRR